MKKINLYMLLIFIAALTGCDDNVNDHFALPQTNPQEPVQNVEGFTLSLGSSCTAPILFKDLDDATLLEVAKLTDHPSSFPAFPRKAGYAARSTRFCAPPCRFIPDSYAIGAA